MTSSSSCTVGATGAGEDFVSRPPHSRLLERYGQRIFPALAAYNATQVAIDGWLLATGEQDMDLFAEAIPFTETYPYVQTIYENYRQYLELYGRYCWPVRSLDDLRLAPFHLLASEGTVHTGRDHVWHMQTLARVCGADETLLLGTPYRSVDLVDDASVAGGSAWWEDLTGRGGEGMVVKPLDFLARNGKGRLVQPALKCRGREYLRLIYGPEYTAPQHLDRLRARGVGAKRALAARELALGVEALERFVAGEPLRRVHEAVFGVLALESEPVDPRL